MRKSFTIFFPIDIITSHSIIVYAAIVRCLPGYAVLTEEVIFTLEHAEAALSPYQHILYEIADSLGAGIYVTDVETDELLFMSRTMREAYGISDFQGRRCWEVLQRGIPQRCDFCPVRRLTGRNAQAFCLWEEVSPVNGRHYENFDGLLTWTDGRRAHFQYSVDVTDIHRSYVFSNIDERTRSLNRDAGLDTLQLCLDEARDSGTPVTLCLFDTGLRNANHPLTPAERDDAAVRTVFTVKGSLSSRDFIFRLTDGEFVAVLPGRTEGQTAALLERVPVLLLLTAAETARCPAFRHSLLEVPTVNQPTALEALSALDEAFIRTHPDYLPSEEALTPNVMPEDGFSYDATLLYGALVQSTDSYLFVNNIKTGAYRYPPAMVREFELPGEVLQDAAAFWRRKIHPHDQKAFQDANQILTDGTAESYCVEFRARNRLGDWVWLRCRGHIQWDAQHRPALLAGFITNLGKRNRLDHITGLPNKLECEDEVSRLLRVGSPMALLILGLDNLRKVNSLYDRAFGDEVIRIAAQSIQSLVPSNAAVYRMDGDEFAVILRLGWRDMAERLYGDLQRHFDRQQSYDGRLFCCTLSCGCALAPRDSADDQELLKFAHVALGGAKADGKNQIQFFSQDLLRHQERSLRLTELLRESVEHDFTGFELYFQPLFRTSVGAVGAAEALCRWRCREYGEISPVEFIPLLEESGLIHSAGRWIFRQAVETYCRWQALRPGFQVNVNLSYLQLEDPTFLDYMKEVLSVCGADPSGLVLELTESHLAANIDMVSGALAELRSMGANIAMDDFGTGYSSLGLLKLHPIDIVKIDRGFITSGQNDTFDNAFLRFACELCHSVDIRVCVEGVETQEALDLSNSLRVDYIQGYYYSKPITASALEATYLTTP